MSSSKKPPASPAAGSSPFDRRSRRDSVTSQATSSLADKEQLAHALDKIHTSASQSDVLTTFNDFGPPPTAAAPVAEPQATAGDLVQQGLSGFYSRLKEAVGVGGKAAASNSTTTEQTDGADSRDAATTKTGSSNPAHTRSKSSVSSLPRGESGGTNSTFNSHVSSDLPTTVTSSSGGITTDHSQMPSSSKASSITTMSTATSASKLASSSQALPKLGRAPASAAVDTSNASGAVGLYKESSRGPGTRTTDELAPHMAGKQIATRSNEPHHAPSLSAGSSLYEVGAERRGNGYADATHVPLLRRDDNQSLDGLSDIGRNLPRGGAQHHPTHPHAPDTTSLATSGSGASSRQARDDLKMPVVIDRLSVVGSSAGKRSPSVITDAGTAEPSPISTSAHDSVYHESFAHDERPQQLQSGQMRIPGTTTNEGAPAMVSARLENMRKQVLSKEFWMADDTCKECFRCGDAFSAFRRKHHCRTCGWIFDSKCTSTISGQKFGVPGNLRVCKNCLDIINRRYDSGTEESDDDPRLTTLFRAANTTKAPIPISRPKADGDNSMSERAEDATDEGRSLTTPMMAIPATRRRGDPSNRNSAILEIDAPQLSRPSSSRSLRSLASARPSSSGHIRHHSKHNLHWAHKPGSEDRVPFRKDVSDEIGRKARLPAFHDDNIIDPELAPYMSDESSGDEQMSIFATLASNDLNSTSLDPDKSNFGPFLSAGRKHRARGEKSISGLSFTSRGQDEGPSSLSVVSHSRAPIRRRNMSTASVNASQHHLWSPRAKMGGFKGPSASSETLGLLDASGGLEGLQPTRSTNSAKSEQTQLNAPSLKHIRRLFQQLLDDASIPHTAAWEKALIPILRRVTDDVNPNTREGDRMDIRHYVKLKKIPGGKPSDSTYVSGVIFTKNLALKSMPRRIAHPRILIISFPIEYQRQQQHQFMSLEPVMSQEKEFLKMVVARIKNHQPEVVLAERNVAGLALQSLAEAGIAVAYNVKASVIGAVSRCVGTPIISSMDMLSLPITVGRCAEFEVKTFVNNDIPGRKKTYIFIAGCEKFLGCTIALRGTSTELLSRMKRVTEFMVYVVYSLKLESCLLNDSAVKMPSQTDDGSQPSTARQSTNGSLSTAANGSAERSSPAASTLLTTDTESLKTDPPSGSDAQTSQGDNAAAMVATGGHDAPPPALAQSTPSLLSMQDGPSHMFPDRHAQEDVPAPTFYSDMVEKYKTKILSASPFVKFTQPYLLMKAREQETRLLYLKRLRDQDIIEEEMDGNESKRPQQQFRLINPEMVHEIGQKAPRQVMEVLHAVHDAEYDKALYSYQTMTRQWENYIQGNLDLFDPYAHQNIVVLYSLTCTETKIPCLEPGLIGIAYYNEMPDPSGPMDADCTLGQYVQDLCEGAEDLCHANGCDRPMWQHHRTYVHGEARVTFFVEPDARLPSIPEPLSDNDASEQDDEDTIYMWTYCKACKRDLTVKRLSPSAWKYSFGKYLELLFWSWGIQLADETGCSHDSRQEHIRYFNFRGSSVRVHYDPIDLLEIVVPRTRITWKVDHDLKLKNEIFTKTQERWVRFITSVKVRIKSIRIDSVLPDKEKDCKAEVERLAKKAQEEHGQLIRDLEQAYMQSKHYEIIPLNTVIRSMAEKISGWDAAFAKFEADYLSDKDVRQLTVIQLRKMFTDESKESTTDGTSVTTALSESESKSPSSAVPTTQSSFTESDEKSTPATSQPGESEPNTVESAATTNATKENCDTTDHVGKQHEVVVPSEQVESLDLATPVSPNMKKADLVAPSPISGPEALPPSSDNGDSEGRPSETVVVPAVMPSALPPPSTSAGSSAATPKTNRTAAPPLVTQQSLTEKVEQLRREFKAQSAELNEAAQALSTGNGSNGHGAQSPIQPQPQPVRATPEQRGPNRKAGPIVSPPMIRAASQPAGAVPRVLSSVAKPSMLKDGKTSPVPDGGGSSSDLRKVPTDNPTKIEKKFSDRIGLGALKNQRKTNPSSIPRFVHKRDSNFTSLTRHFEQLSREFAKERNKERKQQVAKMHHPRAYFPKSSARATVEVYDSVDQAVQEPGPTDDEQLFASQHSEARSADTNQTADTKLSASSGAGPAAADRVVSMSQHVDTAAPSPSSQDSANVTNENAQASPTETEELPSQPPSEETAETATEGEADGRKRKGKEPIEGAAESDEEEAGSDGDQSLEDILPDVETIAEHLEPSGSVPTELQQDKKSNLMKMLSNFWAERSASGWPQLDYPLKATDHIFIDSDVIVREDEPSSLIAFALSSEDYIAKLEDIRRQGRRAVRNHNGSESDGEAGDDADNEDEDEEVEESDSEVLIMKTDKDTHKERDGAGEEKVGIEDIAAPKGPQKRDEASLNPAKVLTQPVDLAREEEHLERSLLRPTGTHLKYQFTEGSARMMCKIFYAEQFDALRRKCGVADRIIESLSRCLKWDSKGGKTKSVFLKTLDDRLVMKSLSPVETAAFLQFAPSYFSIMAEALFHDLPSVIAKMLGFFQVIVKNAATGTEIKLDLLIMENLFYDRQETRKFDLKGSMRNRKIQSTGEQNEVLLDENMVEYIYESPLFAREHAKKLLRASVWNDTLFLARQDVMDYSLMVAVDESRKELVVGIIDCIRTYTWDKKLESWIKDRGFAGGGRNRPTVTSPKEYKSRFREAMERYILQAPNCWHLFGNMPYSHPALAPRARFEGAADD